MRGTLRIPMTTLLLNYIYCKPVGHAVEALKIAKGFALANPELKITVLFNAATPVELVDGCPWIDSAHGIDLADVLENGTRAKTYANIPKEWDYIVDNNLAPYQAKEGFLGPLWKEKGFLDHFEASHELFRARRGSGFLYPALTIPDGLGYERNPQVLLEVPTEARAKRYDKGSPKFCVLLAGSAGRSYYPSIQAWTRILSALNERWPGCHHYITGVSGGERTRTQAFTRTDLAQVQGALGNVTLAYDIGLWNQIALIEKCDVFISPHTGFAFLAPCVATPWLEIAGGNWPAYFFNDIPFYSVFPDNPEYPYKERLKIDKYLMEGKIPCMQDVERKIPEIVEAASLLLDPEFTFDRAIERHRQNISCSTVRKEDIPVPPTWLF